MNFLAVNLFRSNLVRRLRSVNPQRFNFSTSTSNRLGAKKSMLLSGSILLVVPVSIYELKRRNFDFDSFDISWFKSKFLNYFTAYCEAKANRTAHYEKTIGGDDDEDDDEEEEDAKKKKTKEKKTKKAKEDASAFDFKEFFWLLYDEKFYFLAAVAVSFSFAIGFFSFYFD